MTKKVDSELSCLVKNAYLSVGHYRLTEFYATQNCGLCQGPFNLNARVHSLACGHVFHTRCLNPKLNEGFSLCLQEKAVDHIKCPVAECNQPIPFDGNFIANAASTHADHRKRSLFGCRKMAQTEHWTKADYRMMEEFRDICIPDYKKVQDREECKSMTKWMVGVMAVCCIAWSYFTLSASYHH